MGSIDKNAPKSGAKSEPKTESGTGKPLGLSYGSYLRVDELIALQTPLSNPPAHDELLFIVVHQTYELWFKQVLFEMRALITRLGEGEILAAYRLLDRICGIFRVLVQQIDVLETMTPVEFNRFRDGLNPASGFQSKQFRELELVMGAPEADLTKFFKMNPEWKDSVAEQLSQPTLRAAFLDLLLAEKLILAPESDQIVAAVLRIYQEPRLSALHNLCEYLIGLDEQILLWRFRHVQMVERMIGMKPGTGGSLGVQYLQQTLQKKFFRELWDARNGMGSPAY